jgi:hypothetical protein
MSERVALIDPSSSNSRLTVCLLSLAIVALGVALSVREGLYAPVALIWLTAAILATLGALNLYSRRFALRIPSRLPAVIVGLCIAFQCLQLLSTYPGSIWNTRKGDPRNDLAELRDKMRYWLSPEDRWLSAARAADLEAELTSPVFRTGALILIACTAAALWLAWRRHHARVAHVAFACAVVTYFALGVWLVRASPNPHIDVYVFEQESCRALLDGENPYALRFPDIYPKDAPVYGPGLRTSHRLEFGYPYPPATALLALPAYALTGDGRYSQLVALALAGVLVAYANPRRGARSLGFAAAVLLLTSPRALMVVELAWTEPFVILALAATIFATCRYPRLTPYVLGLFLATKQYLIFVVPLAFLLVEPGGGWRRYVSFMARAAVVALFVTLPMAIWNLREFLHSAVLLQIGQPFRNDALAYPAAIWWAGEALAIKGFSAAAVHRVQQLAVLTSKLAFPAAITAVILCLRRLPRTPASFSLAIAITYLAFYSLNKQAFCNYYFFVIAALGCAIAAQSARPARLSSPEPQTPRGFPVLSPP